MAMYTRYAEYPPEILDIPHNAAITVSTRCSPEGAGLSVCQQDSYLQHRYNWRGY